MPTSPDSWQIVPYEGDSSFKKVRVRDDARVEAILRYLLNAECVALLGPPLSEKTHLLHDVARALHQTGRYRSLYVDLWQARSTDEATFFTSLASLVSRALGTDAPSLPRRVSDARAFQNYLVGSLAEQSRHLALLIDHLQALPHDLVHSLLLALRSAYMERDEDWYGQLVAVVTGSVNLAGLSTGPTSPFNIARPVIAGPLTDQQTLVLAQATMEVLETPVSAGALECIVEWLEGDRYLVPRVCAWSAEAVRRHRRPKVTRTVVDRMLARHVLAGESQAPIREAIRMIEEDPDTMLDVLHVLDYGSLPRTQARQMITRTGTDRLQLSGAVVLDGGYYRVKNQAFQQALSRHFTTDRVGHVLRIAGRWQEAIDYLAPRLGRQAPGMVSLSGSQPADVAYPKADPTLSPTASAQPQLLEAIVQSIYAADTLEAAFELLARGLFLGFGLAQVNIYGASPARGQLILIHGHEAADTLPAAIIDLNRSDSVEAQTFHFGNYALRGSAEEARLVAALVAGQRPIGVVTVENYVQHRDPHELPPDLPDLQRFLSHAAGAVENVVMRAAYRRIGQAVLSASSMKTTFTQVLEAVSEALGCDFATLYLLDPADRFFEAGAGVGRLGSIQWQRALRLPPTSQHPAGAALRDGRFVVVRGSDSRLDSRTMDRFGLKDAVLIYLPLQAAGTQLGVLELGYGTGLKISLTPDRRQVLASFADQVAIAVHNMQLLRRTDEALARRVEELEKLRSSSLAVSSTLDLDAVLTRILRDVQALFPGTEATVWAYHPDRELLTVLQSSLDDSLYRAQQLGMDSVTGQVVGDRQPRIVSDLHALAPSPIHDPAADLGLHGMIVVPLISHDRVLGTINIYTYQVTEEPVTQGEASLLKAFAAQAAVAIDNARLHQDEVARQRLEEELTVARHIQRSMLPKACPTAVGWQFDALYQAARLVGGDFYDFYDLPGKPLRLGITIADVADKGVPAALFMALSRTIIRTAALSGRGPASALLRANKLILNDSESGLFLSAVYAILELGTGRLIYANAGHNRPLWYRAATGQVEELGARGIVLGAFEDIRMEEQRIDVAPGDVLVFYTDGVTDAMDERGELFEEARLREVVLASAAGSAGDIRQAITDALISFTGPTEQADDLTFVVVKRG